MRSRACSPTPWLVRAGLPGARVRRAVMMAGGLGPVARAALAETDPDLSQFSLRVFHPVQPMLAQSADGVDDALARLGSMALDYKLDGARVQVHKDDAEVRVFTRNLRDVTAAVPEVIEAVGAMPPRRLVLDGEVLALGSDGRPLPFQVTMRRFGRKLDVDALRRTLPLTPFFFDCLLVDGQDLVDDPFSRRADALAEILGERSLVPRVLSPGPGEAAAFVAEARRAGHEGVMAKSLAAGYAAGSRGAAWLKIKQVATLDLVVLAAEWGSGRRRGWLSNLHLGARDPARNGFVMLGKTFKGLTDELLAWQTRRFLDLEVGRDRHTVFVRPELVVEIAFNDVQASPQYPGGVALRFARVKRYRGDKTAAEADTIETVQGIHRRAMGHWGSIRSCLPPPARLRRLEPDDPVAGPVLPRRLRQEDRRATTRRSLRAVLEIVARLRHFPQEPVIPAVPRRRARHNREARVVPLDSRPSVRGCYRRCRTAVARSKMETRVDATST